MYFKGDFDLQDIKSSLTPSSCSDMMARLTEQALNGWTAGQARYAWRMRVRRRPVTDC